MICYSMARIMHSTEHQLEDLLDAFGQEVEQERRKNTISVTSKSCLDKNVPSAPGVYWIETTMPAEDMQKTICQVTSREKKLRDKPPEGTSFIIQKNQSFYVVYSGTEIDMKKRLKQHLFNEGGKRVNRLGCMIDRPQFSCYKWRVGYRKICRDELRYAIEIWWRRKFGWPIFCIR